MTRVFTKFRQFLPCIVAAAVGIAVTVSAAGVIVQRDDNDAKRQFNVLAENHFMVLQNGLNGYVNRLEAVRALFDSSADPVHRNEFEAFTRPLLRENAAIATLSWVPRVLNSERVQHERQGVLDGLPDYHIKDMTAAGRMTVAPERSEYYPIFYATVPTTSELYGLDLGSEAETLAELGHARDADRLGFSPVRALVSTDRTQGGFLFSLPIYKRGSLHDTIENRRRNLAGFVHGSVIVAKMVERHHYRRTRRPKASICFSMRRAVVRKPCRFKCIRRGFAPRRLSRCRAPRPLPVASGAAISWLTGSPG